MRPDREFRVKLSRPIVQTKQQTSEDQMKAERRQLVWRFLFSFAVIAGTVAVATMVAHWVR